MSTDHTPEPISQTAAPFQVSDPAPRPATVDQRPLYLSIAALAVSLITWVWVVLVPTISGSGGSEDPAPAPPTTQATTPTPPPATTTDLTPGPEQIVPPNLNADGSAIIGNPEVTGNVPLLTIHADYQCSVCVQAEAIWGETVETLMSEGRIKVEFAVRSFLDRGRNNDLSRRAGVAATCADTVGAFREYNMGVFMAQAQAWAIGFTEEQLRVTFPEQAHITGANYTKFLECYDSMATLDVVNNMEAINIQNATVTGTPAYLVNGVPLDLNTLPTDPEGFMTAVNALA